MGSPASLFSMAKGQRSNPNRAPTKRVWRRIYLQAWREKRGLTVEGLAERADVSPGLVSLIENAKSAGSAESLEKLANALGIEVGELFDIEPGAEGSMVRMWVKDSDRSRLLGMAEALSKIKD